MARFKKLAVAVALVSVGAFLGMHFGGSVGEQAGSTGDVSGGFALVAPAFAQTVGRSFLENEAGISVYVKLEQAIDLSRARGLYSVLEDEADAYMIGTMKLLDYDETWWPHVWIHEDGWIVVYFAKDEPTSRLMHWAGYRDDRITTTTLREAMLSVGRELGVSIASLEEGLRYYHWQHPDATRMLVVVGRRDFKYTIPPDITVRDASWSLRGHTRNVSGARGSAALRIDGSGIVSVGAGTHIRIGFLDGRYLTPGDAHEVVLSTSHNIGSTAALLLVFR